jgi:hypothetical protein
MPFRRFDWPWAHHKLEGAGPTIDDAVILPNTPLADVRAFIDTPDKLAAWFGTTIDTDQTTLTISRTPDTLTIAWIDTELIDQGRCHTLTGIIATGPLRSYVSMRTVACPRVAPDPDHPTVGYGTEIWTHIDLPPRTSQAVVRLLTDVVRSGNRHLLGELGS